MNVKTKKQYAIISASLGLFAAVITLIFTFFAISVVESRNDQLERLSVMEKLIRFQTEAELSIYKCIYLLDGYLTYQDIVSNVSVEDSEAFIETLLSNKNTLIRDISILKDTTILWTYPRKEHNTTIGQDLATLKAQKDDVLDVKNNLRPNFTGPVDLLQGETGFVLRIPIEKDNKYWGQLSVEIDRQSYFDDLNSIAAQNHLNVAVYKKDSFPQAPIYGDDAIVDRGGLLLDIDLLNSNWMIAAEPAEGWFYSTKFALIIKLLAVIASMIAALLVFFTFFTKGQLKYQAFNDSLTGLLNRHALHELYKNHSKETVESIDIMMLDIDRFKEINDRYGHAAGDSVLLEFAKRLQSIGIKNQKVFRVGGDEFLCIVSKLVNEDSPKLNAELLRTELSFAFNESIDVITSVGIANYPRDAATLEEAVVVADHRMYEDKKKRRVDPINRSAKPHEITNRTVQNSKCPQSQKI